jgi:hypothetical protein
VSGSAPRSLKRFPIANNLKVRNWVFSLPKRLRLYFLFNRKLLAKLSRCAWKVLGTYLKQSIPFDDAVTGAAIAVHTFGGFQQFNPHLHLIVTDGCFLRESATACPGGGTFTKGPDPDPKDGRTSKTFEALDWLAQLVTHIPNKGEQMVRYYGATIQTNHAACAKRPAAMIRCRPWWNRLCHLWLFVETGLY